MMFHKQGWAVMAAVALVVCLASTALAIEAFQATQVVLQYIVLAVPMPDQLRLRKCHPVARRT